jgi:hypothetical protein
LFLLALGDNNIPGKPLTVYCCTNTGLLEMPEQR